MDNKNLENSLCLIIGKDENKSENLIRQIMDTYPKGEIHQVSIIDKRIVEIVTTKHKTIRTVPIRSNKIKQYKPKEIFVDSDIDDFETLHYIFPLIQYTEKGDIHSF